MRIFITYLHPADLMETEGFQCVHLCHYSSSQPSIRFVQLFSQTPHKLSHPFLVTHLSFVIPHHSALRAWKASSCSPECSILAAPVIHAEPPDTPENAGAHRLFTFSLISHAITLDIYFTQDLSAHRRLRPCLQRLASLYLALPHVPQAASFNTRLPAWERWILSRLSLADVLFCSAI